MDHEKAMRERIAARRIAHEIHDVTYLRHLTGATDSEIRSVIARLGNNRSEVER